MLGFQLDIKKKYELWSLVGPEPVRFSLLEFENLTGLNCEYIEDLERPHCVVTKELTSFWEMLGVHVEAGPSTQEIIATFERCEGWSRDDRKRLAYLAIFTRYIEGRKYSTPTRVSLARLVMELKRFENYPWGRVAFKVLMDSVKGRDISGCYTINGFAQALQVWMYTAMPELCANYGNPLPNNPSPPILAYKGRKGRRQFKKAILSQPAVVSPAKKKVVKEDSPRPQKKARKEASEEVSEEAAAVASEEATAEASEEVHTTVGGLTKEDVKTMFKEIVEAMREGFGTCLKEIKYLSKRVEGVEKKSESVNGTNAGRKSLPEDKGPDVPADASSSKDKAPEPSLVLLDKNQSTVSDLQKEDARYLEKRDAALALCRAKSDRTRKLAASQQSPYTTNSTAKVIIPNKKLYPGYNPFAPIDKKKLKELADWLKTFFFVDDLPISRLIAMCISIPKKHIVVWDNICYIISPEELDVVMEPFLYMVPYLLVECASSDEQRAQYSLEPFTYERPTNIPPARACDCGVYTRNKKYFARANGKTMSYKMAVDIFQELPDAHEFENKDNDANLGAYEG
uniref:DUF1985 domain-containing protein n=1 Tax=Brassica oleracea TaxID=3712 RepID=A0A3P6EPC0_BRAOL|nr:unnamed protein product [Brassica oleracea]